MDCKATNPGIARGTRQQVLLTLSKGKSKKNFPTKTFCPENMAVCFLFATFAAVFNKRNNKR